MIKTNSEKGIGMIEALVALVVIAIATSTILPTFISFSRANTASEIRTGAVDAAEWVLESYRYQKISTLSRDDKQETILVNSREYEVFSTFCDNSGLCDDSTVQIIVEVFYNGKAYYKLQTVYTDLK